MRQLMAVIASGRVDVMLGAVGWTGCEAGLSAAGRARAKLLASMLAYAGISAIYSSEFLRTRQTAQPASDRLHVPVTVVPGGDAARLKQLIAQQNGKAVLVVGHSNTIPALIADLNGPSEVAIAETDYDRLFVLSPQT